MSIGQLTGFATVDPSNPRAFATCDRCGMLYLHDDLEWQFQFLGFNLVNLRLLVCKRKCLDLPNETLRAIVLPPDPLPIQNPRPGFYRQQEDQSAAIQSNSQALSILFTEDGLPIFTEDGQYLEIDA